MGKRKGLYFGLIGINLVYALTSVFTKKASMYEFLSLSYIACILGAILVMFVYALLWQQILSRMPLSTAYMFKGTSLIFVLLISSLVFGESINVYNIIGSAIIIAGIILFAKA